MNKAFGGTDSALPLILIQEVEQIIERAVAAGGTLRIGPHVRRLGPSLAATGFSERNIADELIRAAAHAGIPIEISDAE